MSSNAHLHLFDGGGGRVVDDDSVWSIIRPDIVIVLPRRKDNEADANMAMHEAAVLDAVLPRGMEWTNKMYLFIHDTLARFALCSASALKPYVKSRLSTPFANGAGSTKDQLADFDCVLNAHFQKNKLDLPSRSRRMILHAAYLLFIEHATKKVEAV